MATGRKQAGSSSKAAALDTVERKAEKRWQDKYGKAPAKPTRTIKGKGVAPGYDTARADEIFGHKPKHDLKPTAKKYATIKELEGATDVSIGLPPYSKKDAEFTVRYYQAEMAPVSPKTFRPLNSRELGKLSSELIKLKPNGKPHIPVDHPLADNGNAVNAKVSYETMQGGFTVCCIILTRKIAGPYSERLKKYVAASETLLWRGASRRSYHDRHNQIRAEMLAFERAILCSRAERVPV